MTSTNVYNLSDKPSSRVLKPPGGGQSNIFGSPSEPTKPVNSPKKVDDKVLNVPKSPIKSVENIENQPKPEEKKVEKAPIPQTDSVKQKQQPTYNPITGEAYGSDYHSKVRASTAVRQPPGGVSTRPW